MRDYEIVYIFRSGLTSEEIEARLDRYHAIITDDGSGEITASVHWGKRQLAYPIRKQRNGHYVVAQFASAPDRLVELERVLKLEDDVLRYLIVIAEHALPLPEATPAAPDPGAAAAVEGEGDAETATPETDAEDDAEADAEAETADGAGEDGGEPAGEAAADEDAEASGETGADDDASEAEAEVDAEAEAADTEQDGASADAGEPDGSADAKEE